MVHNVGTPRAVGQRNVVQPMRDTRKKERLRTIIVRFHLMLLNIF